MDIYIVGRHEDTAASIDGGGDAYPTLDGALKVAEVGDFIHHVKMIDVFSVKVIAESVNGSALP